MIHTRTSGGALAGLLLLGGCFSGDDSSASGGSDSGSTTGGTGADTGSSGGATSAADTSGGASSGGGSSSGGASSDGGSSSGGGASSDGGSSSGGASSSGGGGVCGDGTMDAGEQCDDGNADDTDDCTSVCESAICGDGYVHAGVEACDDGDAIDGNGCDNDCTPSIAAQCGLPYTSFTLANRSYTYNDGNGGVEFTDTTGDGLIAPDWAGPGWYRFTDAAGQSMPEFAPAEYACGTDAPGWLNGAHPGVDEGVVAREVCFAFFGDACAFSTTVSVVNCGDFYLYELPDTPTSALRYCGADAATVDPQCALPYTNFSLGDRNATFNDGDGGTEYTDTSGDGQVGPDWAGAGWYRFTGDAGVVMPEYPPGVYACGTDAPGWLAGAHPSVAEGVASRDVCFAWGGDSCLWSTPIEVVDCGSFYLYNLPETPATALRYCGSDQIGDTACGNVPGVLDAADRNVSFNDGPGGVEYGDLFGDFYQSPDWNGAGWKRFLGAAGSQMPEFAPADFACGTDAPGWLNATHPAVADGVVDTTACFSFFGNTCQWSESIQVVNCGDYYLYNLVDTSTTVLRYCGE